MIEVKKKFLCKENTDVCDKSPVHSLGATRRREWHCYQLVRLLELYNYMEWLRIIGYS